MTSISRKRAGALVLALGVVMIAACSDDGQPSADTKARPNDGAASDTKIKPDSPSIDAYAGPTFRIQGTIDFDPKICKSGDKNKDCAGTLVWGLWAKPATAANPGPPLFITALPDAKKGTSFMAKNIRLAPKMYLNLYLDDNNSTTLQTFLPDKGDPVHLDTKPFTPKNGETINRKISFWLRMP